MTLDKSFFLPTLVLAFAALLLSACSGRDSAEVRYEVRVEVDTPEGVKSGSSVSSLTLSKPDVALVRAYDGQFRGEAVAVDLPDGRTLFALVKGLDEVPRRQFRHLIAERQPRDHVADIRDIASHVGESIEMPCETRGENDRRSRVDYAFDCVLLVSFADLDDPESVFLIDRHDAASSLGDGYAIRSITVTITDAPVTTGIEKRLERIGLRVGQSLDEDFEATTQPTLPQRLGYIDFVRGHDE